MHFAIGGAKQSTEIPPSQRLAKCCNNIYFLDLSLFSPRWQLSFCFILLPLSNLKMFYSGILYSNFKPADNNLPFLVTFSSPFSNNLWKSQSQRSHLKKDHEYVLAVQPSFESCLSNKNKKLTHSVFNFCLHPSCTTPHTKEA